MFERFRERLADKLVEKLLPGVTFGIPGAETWENAFAFKHGLPFPVVPKGKLTDPYVEHPVIGAAISIIAEDAACVPIEIREKVSVGRGDVVADHPINELLQQPSSALGGGTLWPVTYSWALLCGEFFWYYPNVRLGSPRGPRALRRNPSAALDVLDPRRVKDRIAEGQVEFALDTGAVELMPLEADKLTQWRRFNPKRQNRGLSLLEALAVDLQADYNAAKWNEQYFGEQNGMPAGVFEPQTGAPAMTRDQRDDMIRTWNQKHGGTKRTLGIAPPGYKFNAIGNSQKEMDFRTLREYARELALGAFGLPPFLSGVLDKANYANARKQEEVYWQGTIKRLVTSVLRTLNNDFLPKLNQDGIVFDAKWEVVNQTIEDYADKVRVSKDLWSLGVPLEKINERLELGLELADVEGSDTPYIPQQVVPAGALPSGVEMGTPQEMRFRSIIDDGREERRAFVWRAIAQRTSDLEARFDKQLRRHFHEIEKEIVANLGNLERASVVPIRKADELFALIDVTSADQRLQRVSREHYERAVKRGGGSVIAELGVGASFDINDPVARELISRLTGRITTIHETLWRHLGKVLEQSLADGLTLDETRDAITREFKTTLGRSRVIARTETGTAFNGARSVAMKQADVDQHEWLTSRDADVRPAGQGDQGNHRTLDGERAPVDGRFSNGLAFPLDPAGPAHETVNCRCVTVAVV